MVSRQAQKRLNKEFKTITENPPPYIVAKPNEENILEWHYVISGPPQTPYEHGQYHGILRFPVDYPFKPPSISMVTPNGRFACNTRLCLSMSDYHPDTWNPAWSVATILTGLLSFMTGDESTTGSISTTDNVKRRLAMESVRWNADENNRFGAMFPDLVAQNRETLATREQEVSVETAAPAALDPEDEARLVQQEKPHNAYVPALGLAVVAVVAWCIFF